MKADWIDGLPDDDDELWHDVRQGLVRSLDRTAAYLDWRRRAHYVKYHTLVVRAGDRLIGLAITQPQVTPAGLVCRVTDAVTRRGDAAVVWRAIAAATAEALFTDFLVVGSSQDAALAEAGFRASDETNGLGAVPHQLSPLEHRDWTRTFSLGSALPQGNDSWRSTDSVYFTKGDGDRDWPTLFDRERLGVAAA